MHCEPDSVDADELACLVRGACGALIFALPVLYAAEAWWLGHATPTWKILLFFLFGYAGCVGLNLFSGFRKSDTLRDYFEDAVTAMGLSSLVAVLMLGLMGVTQPSTPTVSLIKQVMVLAVPTGIGFSLARSLLGGKHERPPRLQGLKADLADVGMTIVGGVFLGLSLAPTEAILAIALQGSWLHGLGFAAISLLASYALIFMADLAGQSNRLASQGALQTPWGETILSYALSLIVALVLLWFMGYLAEGMSAHQTLRMMLVLGLPCTIGGAAGRLLV